MDKTVLILGGNGRFGRHATAAFTRAGWDVRQYDRKGESLWDAAWGASVIVNAWNMPPAQWRTQAVAAHEKVIEVAKASGATVLVPGNVYNFGSDMPPLLTAETPKRPDRSYGRIREEIEGAYRKAGVRTIILRAGDFLDTEASGNWFDKVMITTLTKGVLTYPGRHTDVPHAWAFLPDMARAAVALAEKRTELPVFADIPYAGLTLTAQDMAAALAKASAKPVKVRHMAWLPIVLLSPFWGMARYLTAMRYLWDRPHSLDAEPLRQLLPDHRDTSAEAALAAAIQHQIHPDGVMAGEQDVTA
ncbi:MAG: epimerase [Pseudomonadota bacterium]